MKRLISLGIISGFTLLLCSGIAVAQQKTVPPPPPPPPAKTTKTEKHIKMVKVDSDGKKTELDTVITGNDPFVWNGDTIGGGKENVFIMKSDSGDDHMMMAPMPPGAPMPPHVMMLRSHSNKNVIDLSDPGIISYEKKMQKDGTEKITIVRKSKPEGEEINEDVMIHAPHGNAVFHSTAPGHVKTVKVIKSDDGTTQIIEGDEVIKMQGEPGTTKFVGDDGKVIIVKEIKEGDQKKVEVTVEEEKKEEKK